MWQCETEGLTGGTAILHCTNETVEEGGWYTKEPLYAQWRQLNCKADCRYHCMMQREEERRLQGLGPVKYHGKWPFLRIFVFQVLIVFPSFVCLFDFMLELTKVNCYGPLWHIIPCWYFIIFIYFFVGVYLRWIDNLGLN